MFSVLVSQAETSPMDLEGLWGCWQILGESLRRALELIAIYHGRPLGQVLDQVRVQIGFGSLTRFKFGYVFVWLVLLHPQHLLGMWLDLIHGQVAGFQA